MHGASVHSFNTKLSLSMLTQRRKPFFVAFFATFSSLKVLAIDATCSNTAYDWAFNSLSQSPCQIATDLGEVCDSSFSIPALPSGSVYRGPSGGASRMECRCNTVYYSLLSVCADCQGGGVTIWSTYSINCTSKYNIFPHDIPSDTAVPHWAYLELLSNGTVNMAAAETDTGAEATATATSSSASVTPTSSVASGPETTSTSASSESSKDLAGAIAGGVVGGLLGVGAIMIGIILFVLRRRRQKRLGRPQYPEPIYVAPSSTGQKLYDPNDPATFPISHSPMTAGEYSSMNTRFEDHPYFVTPDQQTVGRGSPAMASYRPLTPARDYRGVPEIDAPSFNPHAISGNVSR
ncbi:uncharacterized protein EV420DRAFT_1511561 [Desarmillaria tabescens]|uniref:Mid2 domain-containing protein n=1 Tax=Armillaria tabescens TaxID=1929756 RepID=A0AA39NIU7_ARMTA|nr:uncharacterized protein EV420DRAFT_1511561 [Desarmillaria tabescens]KAK0466420.1 hypothetical protein EV420DRAFT_1511561 [Desarmillaria tabescens]